MTEQQWLEFERIYARIYSIMRSAHLGQPIDQNTVMLGALNLFAMYMGNDYYDEFQEQRFF